VHVWAIHGTDDESVPASDSQEMVDAIRAAGGEARIELLPGRDHNIVDVYDRKDLYTWLLEHRRRS
jgi:dipeptidyl aminopeptidase/acylaminoacyl peptidase